MTTLLSLDPGGTTGVSLWRYTDTTPLEHLQHCMVPHGEDGFIAWARTLDLSQIDEVVSESFVLDGRARIVDITPKGIETAIKMIFGKWGAGLPVTWQRNTMKSAAPDEFLKAHGLWWKGAGHDRDTARHAIAYMRGKRHMPTIHHFWPPAAERVAA